MAVFAPCICLPACTCHAFKVEWLRVLTCRGEQANFKQGTAALRLMVSGSAALPQTVFDRYSGHVCYACTILAASVVPSASFPLALTLPCVAGRT